MKGSKGIGMHKHGAGGRAPKSPNLRHAMKREAEKQERKAQKPLPYNSVSEAFSKEKDRR